MNSPLYPRLKMKVTTLNEGLKAWECPKSGGIWIKFEDYHNWLKQSNKVEQESVNKNLPEAFETDPADQQAKLSPMTGHILVRYRVSTDMPFYLDRSDAGVWFDNGEWDCLVKQNLHKQINNMFTSVWQHKIRESEHEKAMETFFQQSMDEEGYRYVKEFKDWLNVQSNRVRILNYLSQEK